MIEASNDESWEFLHAMGNCSLLQLISLEDNQLQGGIPSSIGNTSVNLQYFYLSRNHLSGTVPTSIGNLHGLTHLSLAGNDLAGTIEGRFEKMTNLEDLNLEANNFTDLLGLLLTWKCSTLVATVSTAKYHVPWGIFDISQ